MSDIDEVTPAKGRGRKGAGRRTTRSTVKPAKAAAAAATEEDVATELGQPSQQLDSQQPSQIESQHQEPATAASRRCKPPAAAAPPPPPQPAASNMTATTARQSGRLGSRLTGTHAAIPAGSTVTQHDQDDAAGEGEVNFDKRPAAASWTDACWHVADVATAHAKHAVKELQTGRITPQLAAAAAAFLLLWLAADSVGSWRASSSTRRDITALSHALDASRAQITALEQQLADARSQQSGQQNSQQQVQQSVASLQEELQRATAATAQLQAQHAAQQAHWEAIVKDLQAQHSSQQQQWERDLAQLQLEVGAPQQAVPLAAGNEAASAQQWSRIRDSVFLHMRRVLDSFAADRTGRPDYALASAGGSVVGHSLLALEGRPRWVPPLQRAARLLSGGLLSFVHPHADEYVLSPIGLPGWCLALNGTSGSVDIRLRTSIQPQAVTLEHVPKAIAFDLSSAPQKVAVLGFQGSPAARGTSNATALLNFVYDLSKSPVQTFPIPDTGSSFDHLRLQVVSNHGNPRFTCLYRVRVHGQPAAGL